MLALWSGMAAAQPAPPEQPARLQPVPEQSPRPQPAPEQPAQGTAAATLEPVVVQGNYDNAVGSSDAASQGRVTARLIESRPTLRPAEVLEFVPGVIVSQHSGDGKANQYYLRGFNLDHGTDFATFVDGMPVNMPSHAHGQGYSDLNWLIPELVGRIDYRKGPYYADDGDFSSAGSARLRLQDGLPQGLASLTVGGHRYGRLLIADSTTTTSALGPGRLLYALEAAHNDGPWEHPERFHRLNGVLRYSFGDAHTRASLTAMAYSAGWHSTDQIPQRAVEQGLVGRFGTIDPTDGGRTSRYSLSYRFERRDESGGTVTLDAYAIRSRLNLFSNFTYFLDDPVNGDQFEQAERRSVYGLAAGRSWAGTLAGIEMRNAVGVQIRHDRLDPVGLYRAVGGRRTETVQESRVRQTSIGLHAENTLQWTPWLRSVAGLRFDRFRFDVTSSIDANGGSRDAHLASPKLSLILGPWRRTEFFVNYGYGFHSNDARGTTATVSPRERLPIERVDALVRSKGGEVGLRTELLPGLQSSLVAWQLRLDSELVFSGDAGDTAPNRPSLRHGIEWNNHWRATPWLLLDADFAWSQARFTEDDPVGNFVPGAVNRVASLGATVTARGPWFGQLQLRYFGPRPLIEDDSRRSEATALTYLRLGYRVTPKLRFALDVFNLFDRRASDIDYYYASRLKDEPGVGPGTGVDDVHFHPVEPRSARLTMTANF